MENTKKNKATDSLGKKGFYLLPNLFTTSALFAGFYSIVQAMNGNYDHAAMLEESGVEVGVSPA